MLWMKPRFVAKGWNNYKNYKSASIVDFRKKNKFYLEHDEFEKIDS